MGADDCSSSARSAFGIELPIHFFDQAKDLIPPHLLDSAGNKMLGKELPGSAHLFQEVLDILADNALGFFVRLREHQAERDIPFSKPFQEFQVYLLRAMTGVDQYEHRLQVLPLTQIVLDHLLPPSPVRLPNLGKAVAGQIHDIPFVIDRKMVDQLRLAGSAGGLGQLFITGKHVDQGRLPHIASSDKSIFGPVGRRALCMIRAADDVSGGADDHNIR